MAPTAVSPPYFNREELKQTEITLSLACITKEDSPRARLGNMIRGISRIFLGRIFKKVFLPNRKRRTHAQEIAWERTVASAAP